MSATRIARHSFTAHRLDATAFRVLRFTGQEAISQAFRFEIHLVSASPDIDFAEVIDQPATLTMHRGDDPSEIDGIVSEFQLVHMAGGQSDFRYVYRAVLVPRLWRLSLFTQSRIFQNLTVEEIAKEVLTAAGVAHRFALTGTYVARDYTTQYQESDLHFVQRLLEFEGIRYHFEHADGADTLVLSDDATDAPLIDDGTTALRYSHGDGLLTRDGVETVQNFRVGQRLVRARVTEKDYNYETPAELLRADQDVTGTPARGLRSEAMTHTVTPERTTHLAQVRAEEIETTREVMSGTGDCLRFRAGYRFALDGHFRTALNQTYLITHLTHEGTQPDAAEAQDADADADAPGYANRFRCVAATVAYRPPRKTPVPKLPGVLTATVESSAGSDVQAGQYAPIDDQGRYKVRFPFDLGTAPDQQATKPVRLAQPYAGPDYGQHFPLHENAEMVVACVDGDPDRIIGLGAVPNPAQASPTTSSNPSENTLRTAADNEIVLKDTLGTVGINLESPLFDGTTPDGHARVHLGADDGTVKGIQLDTPGTTLVHGGSGIWLSTWGDKPADDIDSLLAATGLGWTIADAAVGVLAAIMGVPLLNAAWKNAAVAGGFAKGMLSTAVGTTMGSLLSGVFITSPGGIMMGTPAGISAYAGAGGIGLTSATSVDLTAATLGVSLLAGAGGISIGAISGGISRTAVLGDIETLAKAGKVTTKAAIGIESTTVGMGITSTALGGDIESTAAAGNVKATAAQTIQLDAGMAIDISATTGAVTIKSGPNAKIVLTPDGSITLKAGPQTLALTAAGIVIDSKGTLAASSVGPMALKSNAAASLEGVIAAEIKGNIVAAKGTGMLVLKGPLVTIG